ncbi:MAG: CFI-box-CTERM domain-containing protein [Ferruginibacter sp.]
MNKIYVFDLLNEREKLKHQKSISDSSTIVLSNDERKRREGVISQNRKILLDNARSLINQDFSSSGKIIQILNKSIIVNNPNSISSFDYTGKSVKRDCLISIQFQNNANLTSFASNDKVSFTGKILKVEVEDLPYSFSYSHLPDIYIENVSFQKLQQSNGACFIATAVYGSYYAPEVLELRKFRDEVLLLNSVGRSFVRLYYQTSPFFASLIAKSKIVKAAVRYILLQPILSMIRHYLKCRD